jgi:large subunit ribosomal protein L10e
MAALRKATAYSKKRARPFTRTSKKKSQAYIKAVPQNKVVRTNMGKQIDFANGKHPYQVKLIADERVQIRDNALEATRMFINKKLETLAPGQYFFALKVAPHHILRENKTSGVAGADRLSSGMKHSYGITIGRAAMVPKDKEIFFVSCANEKTARLARDTYKQIKTKLPCRCRIVFEKVQ